jgi:pimeloyl-ACP methyl ester carboxylesterase
MTRLLAIGAILLVAYFGLLFLAQRRLVFQPPPGRPPPDRGRAEVVRLRVPSVGSVEALYLAPQAGGDRPAPLLLFTHGNAELADDWVDGFDVPRLWGWGVLLLEYPGYGRSDGRPSERSITAAALAAFDWASRQPGIDDRRIVAYGRSLGGAPAARVAAERPVAALVLESAFTSVRSLARRFLAPGLLVRDPFDVMADVKRFNGAVLVVHGGSDSVVPAEHGRALAAALPTAEYHELRCGHNDCPRPWPQLKAFLDSRGLSAGSPP